ncbi:energy transducer TonB [Aromatoleum bremense]|uniref:TonB family protein n=1 Tax=Aromatoleum bremense TaxID=76115 RepID=A0ABX1NXY2_9RHOO|nr:energy transducer TonB [Aromatoleum bremense]NMG16899.1 TonB family protein [Aromatoleum bremense]QTQ32020.1 TonB/TolA, C-terminal domain-containing [Aromatoleum bremense]
MSAMEEYLCGSGKPGQEKAPVAAWRWRRPLLQWSGVGLAHAALLGIVLQVSPQARQALGHVIEASLVVPRPVAVAAAQPTAVAAAQPTAVAAAQPTAVPEPTPTPPRPPKESTPAPRAPRPATPRPIAAPPAEAPPSSDVASEPAAEPASAVVSVPTAVPAAPPPLVLPVFNADYLDNPAPLYPPMSRRLGETGRVLLRVLVSVDGYADQVEVGTSSGFERLDAVARQAVVRWRFVPARRGDERVAAWVLVPISFVM